MPAEHIFPKVVLMKNTRRQFVFGAGLASVAAMPLTLCAADAPAAVHELSDHERRQHEACMRLAIAEAKKIKKYPFGAVIVDTASGTVLASGHNASRQNPVLHAEIAAMNDYVEKHGNQHWHKVTLYTTGEPCPMCMSAMIWANLTRVVWASSVAHIRQSGIPQLDLTAQQVAASAVSFYRPQALIGGVLASETDALFSQRLADAG